jgi:hypothetical protein
MPPSRLDGGSRAEADTPTGGRVFTPLIDTVGDSRDDRLLPGRSGVGRPASSLHPLFSQITT